MGQNWQMSEPNELPLPDIIKEVLAQPREFYYHLPTGEVTEGPQGSARHRLGPYPTREAAAEALRTAQLRSQRWDEESKNYEKDRKGE